MALSLVFLGLVSSCLFFGPGVVAAFVARWKGYRPWFWLLSAGPFGMLLILLKPSLYRATTPEERARWEQQADWAGGILSGFTMFCMFALPILGMLTYYSVQRVATAPFPRPGNTVAPPTTGKVKDGPAPAERPDNISGISGGSGSPLEQTSASNGSK